MKTEPTVTITVITSAIAAIITVLALTWPQVEDYREPIIGLVGTLYPIATAVWIRSQVTPVAKIMAQRRRSILNSG